MERGWCWGINGNDTGVRRGYEKAAASADLCSPPESEK